MNLWKTLLLSAAVLTVGGGMISCSDSDDDKRFEGKPTINVTPTSAAVELTGGTVDVAVTSDAPWTVKADADDVTFSRKSGNGNANVTVTVPAAAERTITVTFTATGYISGVAFPQRATVTIAQNEGGVSLDGTIAGITEVGSYTVNSAWVVATYESGFVMTDSSKEYALVYLWDTANKKLTSEIPPVGTVLSNVNGNIVLYNDTMFQFDNTTKFTVTSETKTVDLGTPAEYGYAEMKAYGLESSVKPVYAKYTGTLSVSGNYYNVLFSESDDCQGSLQYPNADLNVKSFNGKVVDVTGFLIGRASKGKYISTCVTAIAENKDVAAIATDKPSLSFAAAGETLNVTYTVQNLGSNQVFAEVTGEGFTIGTPSNGTVAVTAAANSGTDRSGSLRLYIAAAQGGTAIAETTVALEQKGAVVLKYTLIDNVSNLTAGTYFMAGYSEKYNTTTFEPYSYHIWVGTISSGDCETVNYEFANDILTINPNLSTQDAAKGKAAEIQLVAVDGKADTYYIMSGEQYLSTSDYAANRKLQLSATKGEWVVSANAKGGITLTTTDSAGSIILGTAGAGYNMLRSYKSPAASLTYGVCFFKKQ